MKNKNVSYCSWSELYSQENRERRHSGQQQRSTSVVDHPDYISLWSEKMKEVDPDGSEAREMASRYHT